jgi:hypothetical protein
MTKNQINRNRAIHEASHAVVFTLYTLEVQDVMIGEGFDPGHSDYVGICHVDYTGLDVMMGNTINGELAGIVAEIVDDHLPPVWETVLIEWRQEANDLVSARAAAKKMYDVWIQNSHFNLKTRKLDVPSDDSEEIQVPQILENAFAETHRIVLENWDCIEAVAASLLKKQKLPGKQVVSLMNRTFKKRK